MFKLLWDVTLFGGGFLFLFFFFFKAQITFNNRVLCMSLHERTLEHH